MRRDLIVDLMFIAGKCGAFKNVTMASHSSLFQTLVLQLNAIIIGFMGLCKEEYTALLFIHLPARGRDLLVRVSPAQFTSDCLASVPL